MKYCLKTYNSNNKGAVIEIFRSNMPAYFDPSELAPFQKFLENIKGKYFVCELNDVVIGAGGYCEEEKGEARICWLMIHNSKHGNGAGRYMMQAFYDKIVEQKTFDRITLKTTQHTDKFYKTLGYETTYFEKDHWLKGMHLYFMEKVLMN